jgi:hypothetical protein
MVIRGQMPDQPSPLEIDMPDGSAECGAIMARLALLESLQRQHTTYFAEKVEKLDEKLEQIVLSQATNKAKDDGERAALARLGGRVVFVLTAIGSAFAWLTSDTGHGWVKRMFE